MAPANRADPRQQERIEIDTEWMDWLHAHRELAVGLVPLLAFSEACVGIGLFVSGVFLVALSTWIHAQGLAPMPMILGLAFVGATLGDHVGYWTGRWLGPGVHRLRLVQRHRDKLERAEDMIRRRGAWAILIGRFIPAIRSLIPLALGVSGFDRLRYTLVDIAACAAWAAGLGLIVSGLMRL